ncbi:ATP-grasp domain-containing protein [Solirubrobacter sp. CPCC 204708]|uniref:ATP-grasp domain-containing protein n=1 Tax=Solirubrobacter deserti TaxID=2282478 RepID=A0ABT4RMD0_9ACTN|nr:ATP-grasp domain-containing protein [Solirubrobacter deserti]MBE2316897.1 ATP-grasp domain-containing protein [Solirubrobacter deserti]MDA0139728.1 ATP-grasp domain-containing protein [Solirubrobacter deserti]
MTDRPPSGACLLAGAAGTATAYGLLRSVRERWGAAVRLVAADINPPHLVAATTLADASHQVPLAADPGFQARIVELVAAEAVTVWWPVLDAEIVIAADLRERGLLPAGVAVVAPARATAELCLDKQAVAERLQALGLPTPATWPLADAPWDPAGIVVKPRSGFGSRGLRIAESETELEEIRRAAEPGLVAQPRLRGDEYTIDALRTRDGSTRAVARERIETKAGVSTKARVFEDAVLTELAARLADGLELTGPFCFQVIDGAITDVNPRPGGGTRMTVAAGVDLHCAALADVWGHMLELPPLPRERFVVRHWEENVL